MPTLQATVTNTITPFIIYGGAGLVRDNEIMLTSGAGPDIVDNTVLTQDPATLKWTPLISAVATDGTAWPRGIYQGDTILSATIIAGDVLGISVLVGADTALHIDETLLIFEDGTIGIDDIILVAAAAGAPSQTVRGAINALNIYPQLTQNNDLIGPLT